MYSYPLTLKFPALAVSPRIDVTDAGGRPVLSAAKKLLSSKDEIEVKAGEHPAFKITSQESRITDIPSNWDIATADGKVIGVVDDDFMTALDGMKFAGNAALNDFIGMQVHRSLGLRAVKMYWLKDTAGKQLGFIAPDQRSLAIEQIPMYQLTRKLPFASRFITPAYVIQLGGKIVMELKKRRTLMIDTYNLEARGSLSDKDEQFLIPSVLLTIVYERQHLKDLYE